MPDYFALLNEPRRPWLEGEGLKQKFLDLSGTFHPDKISTTDETEKLSAARHFAEINAAYRCLSEPKLRLLHLLELELGAKPKDIQQIPTGLADLFAEVATVCRSVDVFLAEKEKVTSPLLQVQIFQRAQDWVEKLNVLRAKLNQLGDLLITELKKLDEQWMTIPLAGRPTILASLEDLYRLFGYFNRWNNQIQERIVRLSF